MEGTDHMTKQELIKAIRELIEPPTTPDPETTSDGEVLDLIHELVLSEESK